MTKEDARHGGRPPCRRTPATETPEKALGWGGGGGGGGRGGGRGAAAGEAWRACPAQGRWPAERAPASGLRRSVHLDMVEFVLLHLFHEVAIVDTILLRERAEGLLHAALHALQATHVDVGVALLEHGPDLLGVLHYLVLDPHLLPLLILHLVRDGVVVPEVLRVVIL